MRRTLIAALVVLSIGCDSDQGATERRGIVHQDVPSVLATIRRDINQTQTGVERAATRLARGFQVEDPAQREHEVRTELIRLRQPRRGIAELTASPISFIAAVAVDGHAI